MGASPALEGRVVVVTGASSGLGRATAVALAAAGARVALLARSVSDLDDTLERIRSTQRSNEAVVTVPVDLAEAKGCPSTNGAGRSDTGCYARFPESFGSTHLQSCHENSGR